MRKREGPTTTKKQEKRKILKGGNSCRRRVGQKLRLVERKKTG